MTLVQQGGTVVRTQRPPGSIQTLDPTEEFCVKRAFGLNAKNKLQHSLLWWWTENKNTKVRLLG